MGKSRNEFNEHQPGVLTLPQYPHQGRGGRHLGEGRALEKNWEWGNHSQWIQDDIPFMTHRRRDNPLLQGQRHFVTFEPPGRSFGQTDPMPISQVQNGIAHDLTRTMVGYFTTSFNMVYFDSLRPRVITGLCSRRIRMSGRSDLTLAATTSLWKSHALRYSMRSMSIKYPPRLKSIFSVELMNDL